MREVDDGVLMRHTSQGLHKRRHEPGHPHDIGREYDIPLSVVVLVLHEDDELYIIRGKKWRAWSEQLWKLDNLGRPRECRRGHTSSNSCGPWVSLLNTKILLTIKTQRIVPLAVIIQVFSTQPNHKHFAASSAIKGSNILTGEEARGTLLVTQTPDSYRSPDYWHTRRNLEFRYHFRCVLNNPAHKCLPRVVYVFSSRGRSFMTSPDLYK